MWMGVPVITLAGETHASRVGVSLLSSVGMQDLIAESYEDYVIIATDLANNKDRLNELRTNLRQIMKDAPLTNAKAITRSIEEAYRSMWVNYCEKHKLQ